MAQNLFIEHVQFNDNQANPSDEKQLPLSFRDCFDNTVTLCVFCIFLYLLYTLQTASIIIKRILAACKSKTFINLHRLSKQTFLHEKFFLLLSTLKALPLVIMSSPCLVKKWRVKSKSSVTQKSRYDFKWRRRIHFWLRDCFISQRHQNPQWDAWFARPQSSSCHLWAECRKAFHSSLFLLLRFTPEPLMQAAACHTQGKTTWTWMKIKSLYLSSWQAFNGAVIYCWFFFHVSFTSCQLVHNLLCKHYYVEQMLIKCFYIASKWNWDNICD